MSLIRLTAVKAVANTALRWVPPFLPTLEAAFGASTRQMTTVLGMSEMAGLSTVAVGKQLDRGKELAIMKFALIIIAISSLVSLVGTTFMFAAGFVLVVLGVANCTVAGHSYFSRRTAYSERGRVLGLYETSWAIALVVGAPIIALLISVFGWRGPYVVLAVAAAVAAAVVHRVALASPPPTEFATIDEPTDDIDSAAAPPAAPAKLNRRAWAVIIGSASLAMAGLSVFTISGAWLDEAFGVEVAGLGAVAMGFGGIELLASLGSANLADRLGKFASTIAGIVVLLAGGVVMAVADTSLWIGVIGLLAFLAGFEYGFVTSLSLVTEAMPAARGTTIALSNGVGTVTRGAGTIAGGWLFTEHGVHGTLMLSGGAAVVSLCAFAISRR